MRFINGNRTNKPGQKKGLAGALFKMALTGNKPPELTPQEKYQKMFDDKMNKMMDDLANGKKHSFVIPGTKQDNKPKEVSKSFKATMEVLARKKAQAELTKQKKKEKAFVAKKKSEVLMKKNAEKLKQQNASSGSYFFGTPTDDKKDSWW